MLRILIISFLLVSNSLFGQNLDWMVNAGGLKSDKASTIALDHEGNIFVAGYYNEQAQFGPFDTGYSFDSSKEAFVAKMDPDGNFLWESHGLNYYDDRALGMCVDPQGNVYVTGTCWGGLDWDGNSVYNPTSYTDQIFVTKLDADGNFVWMKNAGVNETGFLYSDDHGHDMISDSQGNLFITGFITNNDYNPQNAYFDAITIPMNSGDTLGFLAKLSNDGNWQWVETFGGIYGYRDNGIGIDDDDNLYVAGGFQGTRTFGTDVINSVNGSLDIFVVKYDNDGNYQYVVQVGDSLSDRADAIAYGHDGHMYVTGEFRDEVVFGTDDLNNYGSSPEDKDIFVAKLTKDGQWVWATKAGSKKGGDRGIGICANSQGSIFVGGQFKSDAKFGDIEVSAGADSVQMFVGLISPEGKWQWVLDGGGPYKDRVTSLACDEECNVFFTGFFKDEMSAAGISLVSTGLNDIMVGKISDACSGDSPPPPSEDEPDVFVFSPTNVFSPNGDGINDELIFASESNIKSHIVILNRWGNVVYEADDVTKAWDGKSQTGQDVEDGTYFYHIDLEYSDGTTDTKHGPITVIH